MLAAAALKCMGGEIQGRLFARDEAERAAALAAGYDLEAVLTTDDLVQGDNCFFAATGITDGELLQGVRYHEFGATTQSLVMRSKSGTLRKIHANHALAKLSEFSSVSFVLASACRRPARGRAIEPFWRTPRPRPRPTAAQPVQRPLASGSKVASRSPDRPRPDPSSLTRCPAAPGPARPGARRSPRRQLGHAGQHGHPVESPGSGPSPSAKPSAAPGLVSTWRNPPWTASRSCGPSG